VPLVTTEVPESLRFHGIEPAQQARGFSIVLDEARLEPGGRIAGRIERRNDRHSSRPVLVDLYCEACWVDIAPQFVGRKRVWTWSAAGDMRNRFIPVWLDEEIARERLEVGSLDDANWRHFEFVAPEEVPRAMEGTFVAFRWRVEARRARRIGHELASLPMLVVEPQDQPVVRVETSPIGTWRLLEWRSKDDVDWSAGPCSVSYEERRPEDLPHPGETRETELQRLARE
jgi:hypothetical protein